MAWYILQLVNLLKMKSAITKLPNCANLLDNTVIIMLCITAYKSSWKINIVCVLLG